MNILEHYGFMDVVNTNNPNFVQRLNVLETQHNIFQLLATPF
jgi:hypothetical protein